MFQEFLKTIPRYKSMYILEQTGDIRKIIRISKMHGKVTDGKLLVYHSETKKTVIHEIYSNTQGEFILHHRRRIKLLDFKREKLMKEKELKELVRIVSLMPEKEWRSFKSYVDYKFEVNGKIEDTELTLETLKTFFINTTEEEEK